MATYAHIVNAVVVELFVPPSGFTIEQCFHPDLAWTDVSAFNPMPRPGWSATQDEGGNWTFTAPAPPPGPSLSDQARGLQSVGLVVTSTGTPALNATYSADDVAWANILALEVGLLAGRGFPGGSETYNYPDRAGAYHAFTAEAFTNFAVAMRDFVSAIKIVMNGGSQALPANTATIA